MTVIVKTPITQITTGNQVAPAVANQPHLDLEANIDDILAYVSTGTKARLNYDDVTSSGLNFAYTSGYYSDGITQTSIPASSLTNACDTSMSADLCLANAQLVDDQPRCRSLEYKYLPSA